jgi:acyl-CoA hydrolase
MEAADVTAGGGIVLTSSVGAAPTFCAKADRILVELNHRHPPTLLGMHDIYEPADPPLRREIPIYAASDRVGSPVVKVDPAKIAGLVETDLEDETGSFDAPTPTTQQIGNRVAEFLAGELAAGRIPPTFLPVQSGVGNIANSVLGALGTHPADPRVRDVHGGAAGLCHRPHAARQRALRQHLLAHAEPRGAGGRLPQPGVGTATVSSCGRRRSSSRTAPTRSSATQLKSYLDMVETGHTPHTLSAAFRMHDRFQKTGDMRGVEWAEAV